MDIIKKYITEFNAMDSETHKNYISNADSLKWIENEIPIFECPDKDIEKTYYYR